MTRAQRYSSHFYSILSIVIFSVIVQQYFWGPAKSLINSTRRRFFVTGQGQAINIKYRKVYGIACYLPTIDVKDTGNHAEKFVAADIIDLPRALIPLPRGLDVEEFNLCSKREIPDLDERQVSRLFR